MEQGFCPLSSLREGEKAVVEQVKASNALRLRLRELGLIQGQTIYCLRKAPSGTPAAYGIRGAVIAIRRCDADLVEVRQWD